MNIKGTIKEASIEAFDKIVLLNTSVGRHRVYLRVSSLKQEDNKLIIRLLDKRTNKPSNLCIDLDTIHCFTVAQSIYSYTKDSDSYQTKDNNQEEGILN